MPLWPDILNPRAVHRIFVASMAFQRQPGTVNERDSYSYTYRARPRAETHEVSSSIVW